MPPSKFKTHTVGNNKYVNNRPTLKRLIKKYLNFEYVKYLVFDPAALPVVTLLILLAELLLNIFVIWRVPYTEIDWIAYMQECEGFLNGTLNYAHLKGDTGPLVYPAAFVYIYSAFYYITSHGQNIRLAQYIFAFIYLLQMWLVLRLYSKSRKVPPYVLVISAFTSYRIHSIYVLRLFNDPVAILFLYAALNLFLDRHWTIGSLCFSLAVVNLGYAQTTIQLAICGCFQLLLGAPFLLVHPLEYLKGSFNFGRIFEHKWTVNYRFLHRTLFENKMFHVSLLMAHLLLLGLFAKPTYIFFQNYVRLRGLQDQLQPQINLKNLGMQRKPNEKRKESKTNVQKKLHNKEEDLTPEQQAFLKLFEKGLQKTAGNKTARIQDVSPTEDDKPVSIHFEKCTQLAILPFFLCNFIGLICARSLHYQFYVWYFHSLPYLTWSTDYSLGMRFLLLGLTEFCWNTYPSTSISSGLLHLCHLVLLFGVGRNIFKTTSQSAAVQSLKLK
ncbi:lethal(2)neighbour of tid protein 2 isoform X2 [Eurosta solidaginis]|uniref:lethal(2)neighbour of tid protein 2 isoform X2 n=1 Tax=Eurosta solidaginis TaxID=178769 RepID=UPI003530AB36